MNNLLISGTILREKAISFAQELQVEKFHASNGWFERWNAKFNVSFKATAGEEHSMRRRNSNTWNAEAGTGGVL